MQNYHPQAKRTVKTSPLSHVNAKNGNLFFNIIFYYISYTISEEKNKIPKLRTFEGFKSLKNAKSLSLDVFCAYFSLFPSVL